MVGKKTTYFLWFIGGWWGLHHIYLGRVDQALAYVLTAGGMFGIGLIRDLFRIPDYVKWENGDKELQKKILDRMSRKPKPKCSKFRSIGMFILGAVYSMILAGLLPSMDEEDFEDDLMFYGHRLATVSLSVIGIVLGIYQVANIGDVQCSIWYPLGPAVLSSTFLFFYPSRVTLAVSLAAIYTRYKGIRYRPMFSDSSSDTSDSPRSGTPSQQKVRRRRWFVTNLAIFVVCASVWIGLLGYGLYYNGEITSKDGDKVPIREAVDNMFKSQAWKSFREALEMIYNVAKHKGFWKIWEEAKAQFDLDGEKNALLVLGLRSSATQAQITKKCRELARENHPDKFKSDTEKKAAQEKFIKIQGACSKLSKVKTKRARKNRRTDSGMEKDD